MTTVKQDPPRDCDQDPIINCHTHIFTADHVPPWIGKTFLPFILPYIFSVPLIVVPARWWYRYGPPKWKHTYLYRSLREAYYLIKITIDRIFLLWLVVFVAGLLLTVHVFYILYDLLALISRPGQDSVINEWRHWLINHGLLYPSDSLWVNGALVLALMLFFPSGRNAIFFVFKKLFSFLAALPDKSTRAYLARYWNIGRFAFYQNQSGIFSRLDDQYPDHTKFIVLPMDMAYMEAGSTRKKYGQQMNDLIALKANKSTVLPFIFIDPRRIKDSQDANDPNKVDDPRGKNFFDYGVDANGQVFLKPCAVKNYLENGCYGFKIYPALGYFPFDEHLLPLWQFAAQNQLPILTHCIRGTIFYRGIKKSEWDYHKVFMQVMKEGEYTRLLLPQINNDDFSNNFTHPLNYLCLLEDSLLIKLLARKEYESVRAIFYDDKNQFRNSLRDLKICMGAFRWRGRMATIFRP